MAGSVNTFEFTKKTAKIGTLHADKLVVGTGPNGGWKPFTPTFGGGAFHANDSQRWRYRIDGTTLRVSGAIYHTANAGTAGAGVYVFTLPTGCVSEIDPLAYYPNPPLGTALLYGDTTKCVGVVLLATATTIQIMYQTPALGAVYWGSTSDVDLVFDITTEFTVGVDFSVELDPTCPALVGTYV